MKISTFARPRTWGLASIAVALVLSGTTTAAAAAPAPTAANTAVTAESRCGGQLKLGQIVSCAAITDRQKDVFRITSIVDNDTLFTTLLRSSGEGVSGSITDSAGNEVCGVNSDAGSCQLGAAGVYKLTLSLYYGTGTGDYTISVDSMRTPSNCKKLANSFFSFASPGIATTLAAGATGHCSSFEQPQGSVIRTELEGFANGVHGIVVDAQFATLCEFYHESSRVCELTGPGPYRIFLREPYGGQMAFALRMPRLSAAVGCPVTVTPGAFGDLGDAIAVGTVAPSRAGCAKLKTAVAGGVAIRFDPDQDLWWTVYDDAGRVVCEKYSHEHSCPLPAAGNYILLIQNRGYGVSIDYHLAVTALHRGAGCATVTGTSWDLPILQVHQSSGVQVNCHPFRGSAGDRIVTYAAPDAYNDISTRLVDSTGAEICTTYSEHDGCVLPADGTYRVISRLRNWDAEVTDATYRLQIKRLSSPAGCPVVTPGSYNAAPSGALGGNRCRILDIPAAGVYRLKAVDTENYETYAQVYDTAGIKVCGSQWCDLPAAGRYTMVLRGSETQTVIDFPYRVALLPFLPTGCPQVTDDPANLTFRQGEFQTAGQFDCVQLASPAGTRILELLPGNVTGATRPAVTVVDATGTYVCDSAYSLRQYSCELIGTAPFYAVSSAPDGYTGAYAQSFPRVSGDSGCPALPRTTDGTVVTTSAGRYAACFTVPETEHAARETFTFKRTSGTGDAQMVVLSTSGIVYCGSLLVPSIDRTFACTLPAGPLTVLLEADPVDATYTINHRDSTVPAA